jgi:hypothetical protein
MSEQAGAIQGWRMNGAKNLRMHLVTGPDGQGEYGIFMGKVFEYRGDQWVARSDLSTMQAKGEQRPLLEVVRR